jgi:hypothetical protein
MVHSLELNWVCYDLIGNGTDNKTTQSINYIDMGIRVVVMLTRYQ